MRKLKQYKQIVFVLINKLKRNIHILNKKQCIKSFNYNPKVSVLDCDQNNT